MNRAVALVLALVAGCSRIPLGDGERRVVAGDLVDDVMLPTLDDVVGTTAALAQAADRLAAAPSQTELDAIRIAWRAAREPWKHADAFGFGPASDLRLTAAIDQTIDPARVELAVADTVAVSPAYVDALGANSKGFHAIEYLIFRVDNVDVLASLTTDAAAPRRRELITAFAHDVERNAALLRDAWTDYAARLAQPASADADYPTIKSVIDTLVNESVFVSELVADARLGKPMGTATGGVPQPALEESGPSDNSLADMTATLRGIRNMYVGTRDSDEAASRDGARSTAPGDVETLEATAGLGRLVAAQSTATDRDVRTALTAAEAAIAAIPRPYRAALVDQRPEVADAHAAVKELKQLLATEVVGVLGATLAFNDNDGD